MSALKISIGILAYNESKSIGKALGSLFEQSLFTLARKDIEVEIIIVPNGCTDDTAEIAHAILEQALEKKYSIPVSGRVCLIEQPGKANAWNLYVHYFSSADAKYLFLMDADIEFLEHRTLDSMIHGLACQPEVWVTVDRPVKDVSLKTTRSVMEKLSVSVSKLSGGKFKEGEPAWICGQLYCGRADILRRIWLPINVQMDDSFIYSMVVTDCFKSDEVSNRVVLAHSASHVFEAYTNLGRLLNHEKWLIVNSTVNELVYKDLTQSFSPSQDICLIIKERNEKNPRWLNEIVETAVANQGWWLIPRHILTRRFQSLFNKPFLKAVLFSPLAIAAFCLDFALALRSNIDIRRGKALGYWGK